MRESEAKGVASIVFFSPAITDEFGGRSLATFFCLVKGQEMEMNWRRAEVKGVLGR